MKKILLVISMIMIMFLLGCNQNKDDKISIENQNNQSQIENNNEEIEMNENKLNKLISMAEAGAEKEGVCSFFISNSVHQDTPGGYGSGMPDSYYFLSDNTYFWDAGDYFDPMDRVRAKAGTWKIERLDDGSDSTSKAKIILNEKYELSLDGNEVGEVDLPGGETLNGLVNYTFTLKEVDYVISETIEFVGVSQYSLDVGNAESPAYEYKLGERTMYSNVAKIDKSIEDFVKEDFHVGMDNWVNTLIELMLNKKNEDNEKNISFDERTANFFAKKEEIKGDRLRKEFSNIRLTKVDNYYELKADLIGDVKIETSILENAMKEIETKKLEEIKVNTSNGEEVVIFGQKPQSIIEWHESVKNDPYFDLNFDETGVPTYDDLDWISAKNDDEWLNAEGVPMYVSYNGKYEGGWVILQKEEDGYYLYGRELAGRIAMWSLSTINEKDSISIKLLPEDKIVLGIHDFYGNLPDDYEEKSLTVEEYYNLSPKDGKNYITEDELSINISNMSDSNYYDSGLEIKDGIIRVVARNDGP